MKIFIGIKYHKDKSNSPLLESILFIVQNIFRIKTKTSRDLKEIKEIKLLT